MCNCAIICLVRTKPIWNAALCVTNFYIQLRWEKQGHLCSCDPRRPLLLPLSFHHPDGETVAHISIISEHFNVQFLLYPWCRQNTLTLTLSLSRHFETLCYCLSLQIPFGSIRAPCRHADRFSIAMGAASSLILLMDVWFQMSAATCPYSPS